MLLRCGCLSRRLRRTCLGSEEWPTNPGEGKFKKDGWDGWLAWMIGMDDWDGWLRRMVGMVLCRLGLSAWERDAGTRGFQDFTHA